MVGVIRNIPMKQDIAGCRTTPYTPVVTNSSLLFGFLAKEQSATMCIDGYTNILLISELRQRLLDTKHGVGIQSHNRLHQQYNKYHSNGYTAHLII